MEFRSLQQDKYTGQIVDKKLTAIWYEQDKIEITLVKQDQFITKDCVTSHQLENLIKNNGFKCARPHGMGWYYYLGTEDTRSIREYNNAYNISQRLERKQILDGHATLAFSLSSQSKDLYKVDNIHKHMSQGQNQKIQELKDLEKRLKISASVKTRNGWTRDIGAGLLAEEISHVSYAPYTDKSVVRIERDQGHDIIAVAIRDLNLRETEELLKYVQEQLAKEKQGVSA